MPFGILRARSAGNWRLVATLALSIVPGCGIPLSGRIYSLEDGVVLPMKIETSYGHGEIRCHNPATGEHFEGTYSGVSGGAVGISSSSATGSVYSTSGESAFGSAQGTTVGSVSSRTANAIATMVGDRGTVLDCSMVIQRGPRPHGMGSCEDNHGRQYRLQF
jgi:hypothetical protein